VPLIRNTPHNDGGISVHLHAALLGHRLRRLVVRRLDARQEFAFGRNAAVDIHGYHGVGQQHVQCLDVFCFQGPIPGIFERQYLSALLARAVLLRRSQNNAEQQHGGRGKDLSHVLASGRGINRPMRPV
jgi:hypothetical protein